MPYRQTHRRKACDPGNDRLTGKVDVSFPRPNKPGIAQIPDPPGPAWIPVSNSRGRMAMTNNKFLISCRTHRKPRRAKRFRHAHWPTKPVNRSRPKCLCYAIYMECSQDGWPFTVGGRDRNRIDRSLVRKPDATAEEPFQQSPTCPEANAGRAALTLAGKKLLR